MGFLRKTSVSLIILGLAIYLAFKIGDLNDDASVPVVSRDVWWGPERKEGDGYQKERRFSLNVPDETLTDLRRRLTAFLEKPIAPPLEGVNFEYGVNSDYLRTIVQYWRDTYMNKWRHREAFMNSFEEQWIIGVNGLKLHYIRVRPNVPKDTKVLPLVLLHGWPGSYRDFYDLIPRLTQLNGTHAFDVVVPSLPGYAFSEAPVRPGMGPVEMAVVINNLVQKIGFKTYYVHGNDWGAAIARILGTLYPRTIIGVHSTSCSVNTAPGSLYYLLGSMFPSFIVDKNHEHLMYPISSKFTELLEETGYLHLQSTRPDTIGAALSDSPAGLAAYFLEKYSTWTDRSHKSLADGGLNKNITMDYLLDNIMIYWVSNSMTTSMRLFAEGFSLKHFSHNIDDVPLGVASACARFHGALHYQPDVILRLKYKNLLQSTDYENGGHFPAVEQPLVLARDIFSAVGKFEAHRHTQNAK